VKRDSDVHDAFGEEAGNALGPLLLLADALCLGLGLGFRGGPGLHFAQVS